MCRNIVSYTRRRLAFGKYRAERVHFLTQGRRKTKPHAEGSHTTRMPHAARHSRPCARREHEAHALGSLLDTLHSPSDLAPPATAHRCSSQPQNTAPPSPSPTTSPRIHAASVELSRRQHTEQQATASARTAEQPHPPPEPQPAAPPVGAGAAAAASAAEDHKRALVHALQKDIRVLESDMSSRMSMLLERLDELLSA